MPHSADRALARLHDRVRAENADRAVAPELAAGLRKVAAAMRAADDAPVTYADLYRVKEAAYGSRP